MRRGPVGREPLASWRRTGREGGQEDEEFAIPHRGGGCCGGQEDVGPTLMKRTGQRGRGGCQEEEGPRLMEEGARMTRRGPGGGSPSLTGEEED